MRHDRLDTMVGGWFVGAFEPSVLHSRDFEVGLKSYQAGTLDAKHHHKVGSEITLVVSGRVIMCDREWQAGDIVTIEPGESVQFEALTDVTLVVVKVPSVTNDKYLDD